MLFLAAYLATALSPLRNSTRGDSNDNGIRYASFNIDDLFLIRKSVKIVRFFFNINKYVRYIYIYIDIEFFLPMHFGKIRIAITGVRDLITFGYQLQFSIRKMFICTVDHVTPFNYALARIYIYIS